MQDAFVIILRYMLIELFSEFELNVMIQFIATKTILCFKAKLI